jgi:hypothetical protein
MVHQDAPYSTFHVEFVAHQVFQKAALQDAAAFDSSS